MFLGLGGGNREAGALPYSPWGIHFVIMGVVKIKQNSYFAYNITVKTAFFSLESVFLHYGLYYTEL